MTPLKTISFDISNIFDNQAKKCLAITVKVLAFGVFKTMTFNIFFIFNECILLELSQKQRKILV